MFCSFLILLLVPCSQNSENPIWATFVPLHCALGSESVWHFAPTNNAVQIVVELILPFFEHKRSIEIPTFSYLFFSLLSFPLRLFPDPAGCLSENAHAAIGCLGFSASP